MPASSTSTTEKTTSKDTKDTKDDKATAKDDKYGELDARWEPYSDGHVFYVLEVFNAPEAEAEPKDGEPLPEPEVTYIVEDPEGKRTEMDVEKFHQSGLVPVSRTKML